MRVRSAIWSVATGLALVIPASAISSSTPGAAVTPPVPAALDAIPVFLAVDSGSGQVLAARDPALSFVPASLTKVMTAYVAFELIKAGKLSPAQVYTFAPASQVRWNGKGTTMYLRSGERVPVDALLHGITTVSANDACIVLAEGYAGSVERWTTLMNAEARKLGMKDSHFGTPNGWPDNGATYVSARDLVTLGQAMVQRHPELYARYFGQKTMAWGGVTLVNHDPTVGVVPGADGIKTGHTAEAGYGFLGSAIRNGRRLMIVVAGAQSEAQRASASRALMEWGYAAWDSRPLYARGAAVGAAVVQNGNARQVSLRTSRPLALAVPKGARAVAALTVRYRGPLVAPIAKGATVAELEIAVAGQQPTRVPLEAAEAVSVAGPFDRLLNGLAGLVS